jgi:hypothetical protein
MIEAVVVSRCPRASVFEVHCEIVTLTQEDVKGFTLGEQQMPGFRICGDTKFVGYLDSSSEAAPSDWLIDIASKRMILISKGGIQNPSQTEHMRLLEPWIQKRGRGNSREHERSRPFNAILTSQPHLLEGSIPTPVYALNSPVWIPGECNVPGINDPEYIPAMSRDDFDKLCLIYRQSTAEYLAAESHLPPDHFCILTRSSQGITPTIVCGQILDREKLLGRP